MLGFRRLVNASPISNNPNDKHFYLRTPYFCKISCFLRSSSSGDRIDEEDGVLPPPWDVDGAAPERGRDSRAVSDGCETPPPPTTEEEAVIADEEEAPSYRTERE